MTHVSAEDEKDEGCMSGLVRALEADNVFEAEQRLQQLHELKNFVYATVCTCVTLCVCLGLHAMPVSRRAHVFATLPHVATEMCH